MWTGLSTPEGGGRGVDMGESGCPPISRRGERSGYGFIQDPPRINSSQEEFILGGHDPKDPYPLLSPLLYSL